MLNRTLFAALLVLTVGPVRLTAQQVDSGTVEVIVRESMGMVDGFLVRAGDRSATTDAAGRARLILPAGARTLLVTRIGFAPRRIAVNVVAGTNVTVLVDVRMEDMVAAMEEVVVSATRTERLAGDSPVRVEVVDEMEVEENALMAPSGITMLLNETPGLRVQAASPTLGTGSVRILGLPGQYTAMLADGLPLFGGAASGLGPLDISPVDLRRVEIIKGAASALYGAQALGGVINLVSKEPTGQSELLLNRRTMGVTDAATWLSHRFSERSGISLLASGTMQDAADVDDDGWGDQSRARRWGVRPRYVFDDSTGRSLFATVGYAFDDRAGGTLGGALAPDGAPFHEGLTGRRADAGLTLRVPLSDSGHLAVRAAAASNHRQRSFGSGPVERDRISTAFAEVTRLAQSDGLALIFGASVQADAYHNDLNSAFDYDWVTPAGFITAEAGQGPLSVSASVRGDGHPATGIVLTNRLALLVRPAEGWSVRLGGGTGFSPPTPLTEDVEAIGLRHLQPGALAAERSVGAMIDINGHALGAELLLTGYRSAIDETIQLVDVGDAAHSGALRNAAGPTYIGGVESAAIWRFGESKFLLTYGYARGSETDPATGAREAMPLLNRHRIGADLMLEKEDVYRIGIEGIWYGRQALDENPYRTESKPYLYAMAIAMRKFGPVELVANFENLLDVRQSSHDSLLLPSPTTGGRWTTDVWAPLEGFMANVAVRYRWSRN